jgi:hypothetical protein
MERNKARSEMTRSDTMQGSNTRTNEQVVRRKKAGGNDDEIERMKAGRN